MGVAKFDRHDGLLERGTHGGFNDFNSYSSGGDYTTTVNGGARQPRSLPARLSAS